MIIQKASLICIAFLIAFTLTKNTCNAQTILNGVISSDLTLSLASSPYLVNGNVVVMQNATLTIEPGVVIKFSEYVQLWLRGKLVANGTPQDTIVFTSVSPGVQWSGIKIDNTYDAKVECSFVRGRYADPLFLITGTGNDTILKLTNSYLDNNKRVVEENDDFKTHQEYFDSCVFSNNSGYVHNGASNCTFLNSMFLNNSLGCIRNSVFSQATIINNCIFHDNKEGIAITGSVTNSTFYNNEVAIITLNLQPEIHYNNIYQNGIGIYTWTWSGSNPINQITHNRICDNEHNIKMHYTGDTYVLNNCWCLMDSSAIRNTIVDFFSYSDMGIVFYIPFDSSCSNISSVNNSISLNDNFKIYPNPAADFCTIAAPPFTNATLSVFDLTGHQLKYQKFNTTTVLHIRELKAGIYILKLQDETGLGLRRKLLKE